MSFPVGVSTWAPGERTPTVVKSGPTTMGILAAAYRGARLEVAVIGGSADYGLDVTVLAGDSRGAHAHAIGSAKEPPRFTGLPPYSFWAGTFTRPASHSHRRTREDEPHGSP